MKYKILRVIFLFIFFTFNLNANNLKKLTLQLSWFDQFQFAGYYVAKEKGFYEEEGLDVDVRGFTFDINIVNSVSSGKVDFAVGRETIILDKLNGKDIVALYALFQSTPLVLISDKISKIKDFTNKKVMTTIEDAGEVSLKAMIRSQKINLDNLNFLIHTHNINDLIDGKTDVMSGYISKAPYILKQKGINHYIFNPKDYGFDMYSDFLYTNSKLVENNPKTVEAFRKASLKGWHYAYANIEEVSEMMFKKYNSQKLTKEELIFEAKELKKLSYFDTNILGEIKKEKVRRIFDLYNIMGLAKGKMDINSFIYNENSSSKVNFTKEEENYLIAKKNIKICILSNNMPYSQFLDNQMGGFISDFLTLIQNKIKLDFDLVVTNSFEESLHFVKEKVCDIIPLAENHEANKEYLNFTVPYLNIPSAVITKNNIPFIEDLKTLKNKKIAIIKKTNLLEELKRRYTNISFIEVNDLNEGIRKTKNSEVYGYLTSMGKALYILQKDYGSKLKISAKLEEKQNFSMATNRKNKILNEILNKSVKSLDAKEINVLQNKWSYIEYKNDYDYTLLWQVLIIISIALFLILYRQKLLKEMNIELNKKVEEKTQELIEINQSLAEKINKEVDENLKKDRILAQQSKMASMGEMIENIAHQWRQPLSVISTGASGIKIKKEMDDLDDEFFTITLESIINSSKYLSHTIDDFRYFFKPNKNKKEFFVNETLDKTINLLSSKFEDDNIEIVKDIQKVKLNSFETELIQVLMNILNNARDALENKKTEKMIFIEVEKLKNFSVIRIKDNAGGINQNILNKIFEPYFTTKHKKQGTGIGLYMCDQIVSKYMNGKIDVSNNSFNYNGKVYSGAEFSIYLYDK